MSFSVLAALGNPGREYAHTRHNAGWMFIDALARQIGATWSDETRFPASVAKADFAGVPVHLVKPLSFMNESGAALVAFLRYRHVEVSNAVVLHDDIAFEPGQFRLSLGGSAAGHNGVASCIAHLGERFVRGRIGIGPKLHPGQDLADHVLGRMPETDLAAFQSRIPDFLQSLSVLLTRGLPAAQNLTNRKTPSP
ncbi:MAG: aminoacyl-tRNA hydrolase [Verrucomicrobia bacterium]|nr:aminoacyl-tRNA hydrolase [Verrucomicrobiota bacterium]